MNTTTNIDALSVFIFLGVFLGLMLSVFYIFKPSANNKANRYQGLMLLSLSLCFMELLLNRTGHIVKVLPITFSTASLYFLIGPFLYLYIKQSSLNFTIKGSSFSELPFIVARARIELATS